MPKINLTALALLLWLVFTGVWAYFHFKPEPQPVGVPMLAAPAKALKGEEKVATKVETIETYKPAAKKKLNLPEHIQRDDSKQVLAAVTTPNDERKHTVTTVVDTGTGEIISYDQAEPLPWLEPSTKTEVGAFYGIKDGDEVVRLQVQQELLQIKAMRVGAAASADFSGGEVDTFVGVGIWARW